MKNTPENIIKRQAKDLLDIYGWFHFHLTQGIGCYPGLPDRIAIKNGKILFLEFKSPKGYLNKNQIKFKHLIENQGGVYYLINDITLLNEVLRKYENL